MVVSAKVAICHAAFLDLLWWVFASTAYYGTVDLAGHWRSVPTVVDFPVMMETRRLQVWRDKHAVELVQSFLSGVGDQNPHRRRACRLGSAGFMFISNR